MLSYAARLAGAWCALVLMTCSCALALRHSPASRRLSTILPQQAGAGVASSMIVVLKVSIMGRASQMRRSPLQLPPFNPLPAASSALAPPPPSTQDRSALRHLRALCAASADEAPECRLPAGLCRRLYATTVAGVAGSFEPAHVEALHSCLPAGSIAYVEQDGLVRARQEISGLACS